MIKIKNRCCYTVTLILCGTLFLTGLTGCKSREAQFLIEGLQEAKAEVDAESSEEKTSGQKSKKDTDDRQNDDGSSAESRKKQAESGGSDGRRTCRKYSSSSAGNLIKVSALHKEVGRFLCFRLCDTSYITHFCVKIKVLVVMAFVNKKPIHT